MIEPHAIAPRRSDGTAWGVFAIWLVASIILFFLYRPYLADLQFTDPDDAMRLLQVRDFLSGQSWFDVTQYRSNPPLGAPMHWSRLVDMPIVALVLALRPLVGPHWAEVTACTLVPLLTLGALLAAQAWAMRRLLGRGPTLLASALLAAAPTVIVQMPPLRIDHHAWQIVMAALAAGGLVLPRARAGGLIAGLAVALWLHISSEGLPVAALLGVIIGLRYALDVREWPRIISYLAALALGSVGFLIATHGLHASLIPQCDSMSPVYIAPLLAAAALTFVLRLLLGDATLLRRLAPLAVAGMGAGALFLMTAGECLKGPFEMLDPIVYRFWYSFVVEGRPIWDQTADLAGMIVLISLSGLIGYGWAAWTETEPDRRRDWISLFALLAGTTLLAMLVMRSMTMAHMLAVPGIAWMMARLHRTIRGWRRALARVVGMTALFVLTPTGIPLVCALLLGSDEAGATQVEPHAPLGPQMRALDVLPPAVMLAPLDLGPTILINSHHSVVATGHHRSARSMRTVLLTFLASPDKARIVAQESPARYLITARGLDRMETYRRISPHGLAAALLAHRPPVWLRRVPLRGAGDIALYEIVRP